MGKKANNEVDIKDDPWYYELYPDYSHLNIKKMNELTPALIKKKEEDDDGDPEVVGHPV